MKNSWLLCALVAVAALGCASDEGGESDPCLSAEAPSALPQPVADQSGIVVDRDGFEIASWNHEQDGESAGEILVALGAAPKAHLLRILDHRQQREPINNRAARMASLPACYELSWEIDDPTVAQIVATTGEPFGFTVQGLKAGWTSVVFRVARGDFGVELESAPIALFVDDLAQLDPADLDFAVVLSGVRELFVIDGALAPSCGAIDADPGYLRAWVDEITDGHYGFRELLPNCQALPYAEDAYHLAFEFDPPNVCGVVNHPEHYGVHSTFHLEGLAQGETDLRMRLFQGQQLVYRSPWVPVSVFPKRDAPPEGQGRVRLKITPIERDALGAPVPLGVGETWHATPAGGQYRVDELAMYFSAVGLGDCFNEPDIFVPAVLFDANSPSSLIIDLGDVEARHWCDVVFTIGLADAQNVSGARPANEDYMAWPEPLGGGYHYLRVAGRVQPDGGLESDFLSGLGRLSSPALSPLIEVVISPHFQLNAGTIKTIELRFDLNALYDALFAIAVEDDVLDRRDDAELLEQLSANGSRAFELGSTTTETP